MEFAHINLREFGLGERQRVDDTPYGGGDGMLLRVEPLVEAIEIARSKIKDQRSKVILLTPRGQRFTQAKARELSGCQNLIFVCARYEGYDERAVDFVDEQLSSATMC